MIKGSSQDGVPYIRRGKNLSLPELSSKRNLKGDLKKEK